MKQRAKNEHHFFEQELQFLYEESVNGIAIFRKDNEGEFICRTCNAMFSSMLESREEFLLGIDFQTIFADEVFSQLNQVLFNLVEYQTGYPVFVSMNNKRYQVVSRLIHIDDKVDSLVLSFSERWRYSPGFYGNQVLLDTLLDGIFIFDVSEDGNFYLNFLNTSHMEATGLDISTDIGKTPYELVDPVSAQKIVSRYKQCVDTRQSLMYEEEIRFSQDAETTWWQTKISPVIINGVVKQIIGSSHDITALKQAIERFQKLYSEYEALFTETAVPIWLEDVENDQDVNSIKLNRYNPYFEQVHGMKTEDYTGKTVAEIFEDADDVNRINEKYAEVIRLQEPISFEFNLIVNNRDVVNLTTLTPVIRNGKVVNIIGSSLDITELRHYQELLKIEGEMLADRVDQQKQVLKSSFEDQDDFLTSITVAFQEPLVSILGLTEIIQLSTPHEDSRTPYLQQVQEKSEQLLKLVDGILKENQSTAEEVLRIHSFDLKAEIAKLLRVSVEENPSFEGRIDFEDLIPMKTIWQDEQRLIRVLNFLIQKAFERMLDDERLVIEGSYLPEKKEVQFAGRIDLSSKRYHTANKDAVLQQFDLQTMEELRNGTDVQLIQLLVKKIGGNLTYQREGTAARVIYSIPLVHPPEQI